MVTKESAPDFFNNHKLKMMMTKSSLKGLPDLYVGTDTICVGCQLGKKHVNCHMKSKLFKPSNQLVNSFICIWDGKTMVNKLLALCDDLY